MHNLRKKQKVIDVVQKGFTVVQKGFKGKSKARLKGMNDDFIDDE